MHNFAAAAFSFLVWESEGGSPTAQITAASSSSSSFSSSSHPIVWRRKRGWMKHQDSPIFAFFSNFHTFQFYSASLLLR